MKKKNFFDKDYIFRLAKVNEANNIMLYLSNNWDKKHILANNKKYFLYQFRNKKKLNIVISINKKNKQIYSIHSFIPYSENKKGKNICGSIACVNKKKKIPPFLGLETFRRMKLITKPITYLGIGTNPKTMIPIIKKYLKHHTGTMNHYYILNKNIDKNKFKIAKVKNFKSSKFNGNKLNNLKTKEIFDPLELKSFLNLNMSYANLPYKDLKYIEKRYFNHPLFKYRFFCLETKNKKKKGILICRVINMRSNSVFRIIDFVGNKEVLFLINELCFEILNTEKHEYVDLLCAGIKFHLLRRAGFVYKSEKDKNIIPDYFRPFIRKNVQVWYEKNKKNLILFKGDADQDTPRL